MSAAPLVGRGDAIALLEHRVGSVEQGGGALVLRGVAGIGKSAVLQVAVCGARARGHRVLATTGVESEAHLPFAALHQLLRPLLAGTEALPGPQRDALLTAFGSLDTAAPSLFLLGLAVLNLLADAASSVPLVLVADDAHWFDVPTAEVLAFVARRLDADPILFLAAIRDGFETPLLAAGLPEAHLEPLDSQASVQLLEAHAPDLPAAARARVLLEAAGNPLALVELPRALGEPGHVRGHLPPELLPLTDRLQRAFATRASGLPLATRTALLVSAADETIDVADALAATARVCGSAVTAEVLEPAVLVNLVAVDERSVHFRHPLVRSAVYQSAPLPQRRAVHSALAEVLAAEPDRRAWHRAASTVGTDAGAAADLEAAARRAQQRGAMAVAAAAQERAAGLTEDPTLRAARLLVAAEMGFELGQPALVGRLLDEAQRLDLGPRDRARTIWLREIFYDGTPGDASEVRRLVDCADETPVDHPDLRLSLLHAAAVRCWWADAGDAARDLVLAAVDRVPVDRGDPRVLEILALAAPVEQANFVVHRVAQVAASGPQEPATARLLGFAAHAVGDFGQSFDLLGQAAAGLRAQGRLGLLAQVLTVRAWDGIHLGRFDEATPDADAGIRMALETGQPVWTAGSRIAQALLAGVRGEHDLAEALALDAERAIRPRGLGNLLAVLQLARGVSALCAGSCAEAFDGLRRIFRRGDAAFNYTESYASLRYAVEAALHAGRREEAIDLMREVEALGQRTPAPLLQAGLRYARAVLANEEQAEGLYTTALLAEPDGSLDQARLRLAYGVWLRRRRRVAESRDPLREAREAFDRLGATPWADEARRELRASGERSPTRQTATREPLSPQELQIARLAADGLSNRDIAERLFLSHRTVGSHLYRVFPKLGIVARSELGAALAGAAGSSRS